MWLLLPILTYWSSAWLWDKLGFNREARKDVRNTVGWTASIVQVALQQCVSLVVQLPQEWGYCWRFCFRTQNFSFWSLGVAYGGFVVVEYIAHALDHRWYDSWFWGRSHRAHHGLVHHWSYGAVYVSWVSAVRGAVFHLLTQLNVLDTPWREFCVAQALVYFFTVAMHCDMVFSASAFHRQHHEKLVGNYSNLPPFWLDSICDTRLG